jgi:hypothetical protein
MHLVRATVTAAFVSLAVASTASAQGPCDLVLKQGAQVLGAPAGKTERLSPVKNIEICSVWSADSSAKVTLTLESGQPAAQGLSMSKMIAKMSKDVGQFRDEAGLGADAFSLREQDKVFLRFGAGSTTYNVQVNRDRGLSDADVERARQFAKQVFALK